MPTQALEEGHALSQLVGNLKTVQFGHGGEPRPPSEWFTLLIGPGGSGKTQFISSCPYCIRVDADRQGPVPGERCVRWPQDTQSELWFADIEKMIEDVINTRKRTKDTSPLIVCFDTLASMLDLAIRQVEKDHNKKIEEYRGESGKTFWAMAYRRPINLFQRCRQNGIGVWIPVHYGEVSKPRGDGHTVVEDMKIPNGLWSRLEKHVDCCGVFIRSSSLPKDEKGKPLGKTEVETYSLHFKVRKGHPLYNVVKIRQGPITFSNVPKYGAWQQFEQLCNDATAEVMQEISNNNNEDT